MVAVSQSALDAMSAVLIYLIAMELEAGHKIALAVATLHTINPFQVIWVPITATEILGTFLVLLITLSMLRAGLSPGRLLWLGILIGLATLLRQYLGLFIVIALVAVAMASRLDPGRTVRGGTVLAAGFCLVLSPWVVRNWVNHGEPLVLMGETRGYYNYGPDAVAFERLFNKLDENVTSYFYEAARQGEVDLRAFDLDPGVEARIDDAVTLAHLCGTSFIEARGERTFGFEARDKACEARVIGAFDRANRAYRDSVGFFEYHRTRLDALYKAFFKNSLVAGGFDHPLVNGMMKLFFGARTIVVICGFLSVFFLSRASFLVILFPLFMYVYIPVVTIHTEMRYLIQADTLLLALSGITFARVRSSITSRVRV